MFYIWLFIAISLAILEMTTTNLVSIWFIISSLVAMVTSLFIESITIQITIFVLLGLLLLLLTKNAMKKLIPEKEKTNLDRIIGMKGIVTQKITKKTHGEVKVDGKLWTAIADENIPIDSTVKILEINSTKLKVERMEE